VRRGKLCRGARCLLLRRCRRFLRNSGERRRFLRTLLVLPSLRTRQGPT